MKDQSGWGCFLALAMIGVVASWVWDALTWPFRIVFGLLRRRG